MPDARRRMTALPDFTSRAVLAAHVDATLGFYERHAFDPEGGFFHHFKDDGSVYDRGGRHIVSATRFVFVWAMAHEHTGRAPYRDWARHALAHLEAFRRPDGLYAWTLRDGRLDDDRALAYAQAFVLLARAHAHRVGLVDAAAVADAFDRLDAAFWEPAQRAAADERDAGGRLDGYRGQNANMHLVEACLAAHGATGEPRYLERAETLIERFAFGLAAGTQGLVWEHYTSDWQPDWHYNEDQPGDMFRPWGFQTGHQTEWAKLLATAWALRPERRWLDRAAELQAAAYRHGWDAAHGGLVYGFGPDRKVCDAHKHFWVQAESIAAAWRLWRATGEPTWRRQYDETWAWSWRHLVDHVHGAWFRVVAPDGTKIDDIKSPAGKVDYHTTGACWDVMSDGGLGP